jgi:hypothetical protein
LAWSPLPSRDDRSVLSDGLGYHIAEGNLSDLLDSSAVKELDNEELRIAISNWGRIRERLYRTAAEPLGARLPDCSNIVSAISSDPPLT